MRFLLTCSLTICLLLGSIPTSLASGTSQTIRLASSEPDSGAVVCPPGVYTLPPDDCLPLGPSQDLAQLALEGIPYPNLPLPAYKPDLAYADMPYLYFKINENGTPFYASLEDAIANQPSGIHLYPSSHLFVSYQALVDANQDTFYQTRAGWWLRADGGRLARYNPPFQGLLFSSTPRNAFGWMLEETISRQAPGLSAPESGFTHFRYEVVQIYATQTVDSLTWNLIGPGEWIESRRLARVDLRETAPLGVANGRWIDVNLFEQTLAVYENNRLVFATLVSTGVERFWTRPGTFQIQRKLEAETMMNSVPDDFYYLEDVPWTMYFDQERALHGAYWHNYFGYQMSHGCVNLSPGDAHWLFDWAQEGDWVVVEDPSGQTPTDSAVYGAGAP